MGLFSWQCFQSVLGQREANYREERKMWKLLFAEGTVERKLCCEQLALTLNMLKLYSSDHKINDAKPNIMPMSQGSQANFFYHLFLILLATKVFTGN